MEETNQDPVGTPETSSGSEGAENNQETKDTVAYSTFLKALDEKKSMAKRLKEFEDKFKSIETEKLEAEGKKDEVIQSLRSQLGEISQSREKDREAFIMNNVNSAVASKAKELGWSLSTDELVSLIGMDKIRSLEVDEMFRPDLKQVESLISEHKRTRPVLYSGKKANVADGVPGGKPTTATTPDLSKLSNTELDKLILGLK